VLVKGCIRQSPQGRLSPRAVATNLAGSDNHGADLDELSTTVFDKLTEDAADIIGYGVAEKLQPELSGQLISTLFADSASRFKTRKYQN